jgi:hypothetical protein
MSNCLRCNFLTFIKKLFRMVICLGGNKFETTWAQVASAISSFGIIYQKKGVAHVPIPPIKC